MKITKLNKKEKQLLELLLIADTSEKIIQDYFEEGVWLVAERNVQRSGVLVLLHTKPNTVEIMNIAVDEDYQGRGIGKQLIHNAIAIAKEEVYQVIEIGTGNSSISQLSLYQKCGFRMVEIDHDF